MTPRTARLLACSVLAAGLGLAGTGCSTLGYYAQSISGQLDLMSRRRPIATVLEDPATAPRLQARLRAAQAIRRYASETLALPDNGSYRSYADLGRPYAVWNVFAAPELSLELRTWCFPFAGCVAYRGYFDREDAQAYAGDLARQGLDTAVAGAAAYSTLGWFDDPVLSTVVHREEAGLAGLIFHELAHQRLYVKGDTAFNEGFATAVEIEGVLAWLGERGDAGATARYLERRRRGDAFRALVAGARARLAAVYAGGDPPETQRLEKARILAGLREDYRRLAAAWGEDPYGAWFDAGLNNARLGAVGLYDAHVPAFRRLFRASDGDFAAFYSEAERLAALPEPERRAALAALNGANHGEHGAHGEGEDSGDSRNHGGHGGRAGRDRGEGLVPGTAQHPGLARR